MIGNGTKSWMGREFRTKRIKNLGRSHVCLEHTEFGIGVGIEGLKTRRQAKEIITDHLL